MPGSFSNFAETKILDHFFGGNTYAVPTLHLGYFITDSDDMGAGAEPASGNYARVAIAPEYWLTATSQITQTVQDIVCPRATGVHGNVVGVGLFDSSVGGNYLAYFPVTDEGTIVETRDSLVILSGGLVHQFNPGGFSNYLKNAILNHFYKGIPMPVFPTLHSAYMTSAPTDAAQGTEPSVGDYARVAVANNSVNFALTGGGIKENATALQFPIASAAQGTATHLGWFTAATGGQFLAYGELNPPKAIGLGSQLILLAGDMKITVD